MKIADAARELRARLERAHPNAPTRRRLRWTVPVAAALVVAAASVVFLRPSPDPVATIDAQYADVESLLARVPLDHWNDDARREFRTALDGVDRAIEQARAAVRRSPDNDAFRDLCHLAHRARRRLIEAHLP